MWDIAAHYADLARESQKHYEGLAQLHNFLAGLHLMEERRSAGESHSNAKTDKEMCSLCEITSRNLKSFDPAEEPIR